PKIQQNINECFFEAERLLRDFLDECNDCDIVCLPERWIPFRKNIVDNYQKERGETYEFVKYLAKNYKISILSGAIWENRRDEKKPFITCYYFDDKGKEIGRQDKIHLYTYERKYFTPSNTLNLFKCNNFKFSVLICFDLAFYETPRLAAENGADFLFSPTQIRSEGMDNWKIYLQARALENRIPIAACNTVGSIFERNFEGNSKIISFHEGPITPSKLKIVEGPICKGGYIYDDIDINLPRKMRKIRLREKIDKNIISIVKNW
ncbi:MAG: hypothetical protein GF353_13595, partial [Candidatus Lokiarchaeota archaeon]|nr:hypothetical protein [Candidatus Lokiarchaeota archaeon]